MKTLGIIAEYNPFHSGHAYQIARAKELTQSEAVVILMSGNVVQRGEFAILDKWQRAELAISYGADLVIELPLVASLQSADYFAQWGVELFSKLKIDTLVFGTESATIGDLESYYEWYRDNKTKIDSAIQNYLRQGESFPAANQMAVETIINPQKHFGFDTSSANHLLAIQYVNANRNLMKPLKILSIPRLLNDSRTGRSILSGSQIRQAYWAKEDPEGQVPRLTQIKLEEGKTVHFRDYYPLLRYQIISQSPSRLADYNGINYGLESYIYRTVKETTDFKSLVNSLTTRRWPQSSIQRKLMTLLLNIHKSEWQKSIALNKNKPALRVLAFSDMGQKLLRNYRDLSEIDLFSNLNQDVSKTYALNLRADRIFQENPNIKLDEQNIASYPIKSNAINLSK